MSSATRRFLPRLIKPVTTSTSTTTRTSHRTFSSTPTAAMRAYYYDNAPGDQRLPHDSGRDVPEAVLKSLGINLSQHSSLSTVDALAKERGYKNRDEVTISPAAMGEAYEGKVKMFFDEHLHEDEEIRYIRDGAGYFDVRNKGDEWVRIRMEEGDLMIMPAGSYHRFTTDENNYIKAMRLFKEDPKWTPLNRGAETDENTYRKSYLQARDGGNAETAFA